MKINRYFILGLSAFLAVSSAASAATIVASHDNLVLNSQSSTVQDASGNIVVKYASNNIRKSWLKFDLTGQNADYSQAGTITLTLAANSSSDATFKLALYALNDTGLTAPTWTEDTLTWNNAPGNVANSGNTAQKNSLDAGETTLLGTTATIANNTPAGTSFEFNLTNLSTYLQSDNTITVIAMSSSQTNAGPSFSFASSENATEGWRPTLAFAQVPEPSAAALLTGLVALMGVCMRSGRRR
ncbi:DNRLRE domain-containing protein [Coraliomargarita sp. SDUM461003]|uniref:DNRLRE domain-containing protein n=1 Tax=Thalassobacterium maritimum TaxID=3041265 RepID=A0ABU1AWJ8_9BACT|nr:DNRLRE domain-containing protein [Coraliomargarita sp. SDUM461003]MDQ8207515.1 DNRLRE domain-containing protein [Coraliomargarita sp. SDUM461003]